MTKVNFYPFAFFEGKIVPFDKANVSIATHSLQYGIGCFGGLRIYYNHKQKKAYIFRLHDHFERFVKSAKILGLPLKFSFEELIKITLELVRKNNIKEDSYIRPFLYTSELRISPNVKDIQTDFAEYMLPLGEYLSLDKGLSVCISSWIRISDTMIPARAKAIGGYINSALAKAEADQNGFDEAILLNSKGFLAEGSAENIFIVKANKLITPDASQDILEGITRRTVMEIAKKLGIEIEERSVARTEIYSAEEVFFTGTGVQIAWIKKVDGRLVGNGVLGEITKKIRDYYFKMVKGEINLEKDYLTKV